MEDHTDETLLDLYFAGEASAFQAFHRRHAGRVVAYGLSKGLSRELASEAQQEAFLKLHRSIHRYEKGRPALPWFFSIVHNCVMDALRQGKRLNSLKSQLGQGSARHAVPGGTLVESQTALAELSDDQRRVVEMRVFEELSFGEIAVATGKSEVSLRKTFERARVKLRSLLFGDES